jgi:hypothetical protein
LLVAQKESIILAMAAANPLPDGTQRSQQEMLKMLDTATTICPGLLSAYILKLQVKSIFSSLDTIRSVISSASKACGPHSIILLYYVNLLLTWSDPTTKNPRKSNIDEAEQILYKILDTSPAEPNALYSLFVLLTQFRGIPQPMTCPLVQRLLFIKPQFFVEAFDSYNRLIGKTDA